MSKSVESLIRLIRGQRIILDADLARVYGVPTKQLNQAVRRNLDRFPDDFAFRLANQEVAILRSQIVTSSRREIGFHIRDEVHEKSSGRKISAGVQKERR